MPRKQFFNSFQLYRAIAIVLATLVGLSFAYGAKTKIFEGNDHCVAWKAKKKMFLVKTVKPVGKNCKIQTRFEEKDGKFRLVGIFPGKEFKSDEKDRDEVVVGLISSKEHPNLRFESKWYPQKELQDKLEKERAIIEGKLFVNGKSHDVGYMLDIVSGITGYIFKGALMTSYSNFGIKVPNVAGGLVAKVDDHLELHLQLQSLKIDGFDKVSAPELEEPSQEKSSE